MAKADSIISEISDHLQNGLTRAKSLAKIVKKWQISSRTFDRHWKKANDKAKEVQQVIETALNDTLQAEAVEALKKGLKSDLELEAILCSIATGGAKVEEFLFGNAILRDATPNEVTKAIELLFKKRGSLAPTKVANTDVKGNDITPYSDLQVDKILTEIRKSANNPKTY